MKYSPSMNGFYLDEIHGKNIPVDAVEITDEEYCDLMTKQAYGHEIHPSANGTPTTIPPEATTIVSQQSEEIKYEIT